MRPTVLVNSSAWGDPFSPSAAVAVAIAVVIAITAWRRGSLTQSGALAATLVGSLALRAGWPWGGFLLAWFTLATLASRMGRERKAVRTSGVVEKGAQRDARQVFANGGVFAAAAAVALTTADASVGDVATVAALCGAAALSAAGADTMATEIGTWVGGTPRSVRTWREVPPGTSGAVSAAGSAAMCGSAVLFAALCVALGMVPASRGWVVAFAAMCGAVIDTVLGAMVQDQRWCPTCRTATEQREHVCGTATVHRGGWHWLGNDGVNLACTVAAAVVAWIIAMAVPA